MTYGLHEKLDFGYQIINISRELRGKDHNMREEPPGYGCNCNSMRNQVRSLSPSQQASFSVFYWLKLWNY